MQYKEMVVEEGRESLPYIWNLFFRPLYDENFFVAPWGNREFADCAEFWMGTGVDDVDKVLFFVSDRGVVDFLKKATDEIYLFGAYNQIHVCQMRARGKVVLEVSHPEMDEIKTRLRLAIKKRIGASVSQLDEAEAEVRYAILDTGLLFSFHINSYAYNEYERG